MTQKPKKDRPAGAAASAKPQLGKWIGIGVGAGIGSAAVAAALLYSGSLKKKPGQK